MTVILICGIPNAGKTTYSKRYSNVIHYDEIPLVPHKRYEKIIELAKEGGAVIEGMYDESFRRAELVSALDEPCICIWLNTPLEVCLEREANYRKRSPVMVKMHSDHFEPPTYSEGWDEIIEVKYDHL